VYKGSYNGRAEREEAAERRREKGESDRELDIGGEVAAEDVRYKKLTAAEPMNSNCCYYIIWKRRGGQGGNKQAAPHPCIAHPLHQPGGLRSPAGPFVRDINRRGLR